MFTVKSVLVIVSLVLFSLAAVSIPTGRFSLLAGGLFCWELSSVV